MFEGNHLLPENERKQPQTLKRYAGSFKMFLNFIIARRDVLVEKLELTQADSEAINSAIKRVEMWSSTFDEATAARKNEKRKKNMEVLLTREEIHELVHGKKSVKMQNEFLKLKANAVKYMEENRICQFRDYLMLMVLIASAQRPGSLANLTIEEFTNGETRLVNGRPTHVTSTGLHKTGMTQGPACLFLGPKGRRWLTYT